jgi:hypothetical protein
MQKGLKAFTLCNFTPFLAKTTRGDWKICEPSAATNQEATYQQGLRAPESTIAT